MAWTTIKQIFSDHVKLLNRELEVRGWIRTQRQSKNFAFIELNDGSCFKNLQVVYGDRLANFVDVAKYPLGSSLKITGTLVPSPAAGQPFELQAEKIEAIGLSALDYPLQKKRHSFEFLRTIPHLRPRTNTFMAVFRVRSLVAQAIHRFFHERGFVYVHTPIITGSDCEGAGEMFTSDSPRRRFSRSASASTCSAVAACMIERWPLPSRGHRPCRIRRLRRIRLSRDCHCFPNRFRR